jgi:hypothetical protein
MAGGAATGGRVNGQMGQTQYPENTFSLSEARLHQARELSRRFYFSFSTHDDHRRVIQQAENFNGWEQSYARQGLEKPTMWWLFVPLLICCSALDIVVKLTPALTTSTPASEPPSPRLPNVHECAKAFHRA